MNIRRIYLSLVASLTLFSSFPVEAGLVYKKGRGLLTTEEYATHSVEYHYDAGIAAYANCRWQEAVKQLKMVVCSFPDTSYAKDAYFYLGVSLFYVGEFDFANIELTNYLRSQCQPSFFEEALQFKFAIADAFRCGAKRRLFSHRRCPKWATGRTLALTIYDEVIASVPSHEIAVQALYAKGCLLMSMEEYLESIEAFQILVRRFPKHELAPESYLAITRAYLFQSECEIHNPDLLALAEINVRRFKEDFPREERVQDAEADILAIKEVFARGLYDTGLFYERVGKPLASVIYYRSAVYQFPDTAIAGYCREKLIFLDGEFEKSSEDEVLDPS